MLIGLGKLRVIGTAYLRQTEIADIDGIVIVTPDLPVDVAGGRLVIVVEWLIPHLRGIPDLIATGKVYGVADTGVGASIRKWL